MTKHNVDGDCPNNHFVKVFWCPRCHKSIAFITCIEKSFKEEDVVIGGVTCPDCERFTDMVDSEVNKLAPCKLFETVSWLIHAHMDEPIMCDGHPEYGRLTALDKVKERWKNDK